jgi:Na+/melibiose symporter-like transporter
MAFRVSRVLSVAAYTSRIVQQDDAVRGVQALWLIGPTAMLVTSIITTSAVAYLDHHTEADPGIIKMLARVAEHAKTNTR